MADNTNLGSAGNPAIHDDDPFAELTRIMGFDPREPVKPAAAVSSLAVSRITAIEPEPVQVAVPDLAIDLERELMGNFLDDEDYEKQSMASADMTPGEMTARAPVSDEYDAAAVAEEAAPSAPKWFRPVEVETDLLEVEGEPEFSAEAHEPVETPVAESRPVVEVPLAEAEMSAGAEPLDPEVFEATEIEMPASAQAWSATEDAVPEADIGHVTAAPTEMETVVETREPWFEPELPMFDDWADQPVEVVALSEKIDPAEVPAVEAIDLASAEDFELADDLDEETEIDMPPVEAASDHPADLTVDDEDHAEPQVGLKPTHEHEYDEVVAAARSYLARQGMVREAGEGAVMAQAPEVAQAAAAASEPLEVSLEQELNVLLGDTQAA